MIRFTSKHLHQFSDGLIVAKGENSFETLPERVLSKLRSYTANGDVVFHEDVPSGHVPEERNDPPADAPETKPDTPKAKKTMPVGRRFQKKTPSTPPDAA